ncbi:HmuY family protein [Flavobacterium sp.]|uniref:HmuY family protein n=1 Tax=Flavobacterium sp. TaxID=239 RepID=UPI0011F9CAC7|nr:HmuY family protein [Flavobacterium sp.]RZJ70819.1 MAG: hypothetical protein EOO49_11795 [Flavobacterium sp.]
MMKKLPTIFRSFPSFLTTAFCICFLLLACESEDQMDAQPFVVAFEKPSYNHREITGTQLMRLVFSEKPQADGFVKIRITPVNAVYGVDFDTYPAVEGTDLLIPFHKGETEATFEFNNLIYPFNALDKEVLFEIVEIDYPHFSNIQGYKTTNISFSASLGATLEPAVGGPNQGNQIFIDLSLEKTTSVLRDSWDLGFYGGEEFRVAINGSIYMAAKKLDATNIDAVTAASVAQYQAQVSVGTFDPANAAYIDNPNGLIGGNAMGEVSEIEADNHVYLVNMGYTVGTTTPLPGSVAIAGNPRGWKKVKVMREGDGYRFQYADLTSATHQEVVVGKNSEYNFTFFSFNTNAVVSVEPEKDKWDLSFTVFTNIIDGAGSYGYSDFVLNNLKAGVKAYRVNTSTGANYATYALADVNESNLQDDQRVIGADWRDVFTGSAYADRFYVLKDSDGNWYKIKMLGFLNQSGVRGYPKFEYRLLQ